MSSLEHKPSATTANQQDVFRPTKEDNRLENIAPERLAVVNGEYVELSATKYFIEGSDGQVRVAAVSPFIPTDKESGLPLIDTQITVRDYVIENDPETGRQRGSFTSRQIEGGDYVELLTPVPIHGGGTGWESRVVNRKKLLPENQAELVARVGEDPRFAGEFVLSDGELAALKDYVEHKDTGPRAMTARELGGISVASTVEKK